MRRRYGYRGADPRKRAGACRGEREAEGDWMTKKVNWPLGSAREMPIEFRPGRQT